MSLLKEYIENKWSIQDYEKELKRLIAVYNAKRKTYLFLYVAAIGKPIPDVSMNQSDFFTICDLLSDRNISSSNLDMYIETPGGSGETAEEIGRYLHDKFEKVNVLVSGEAKSAGTILVLSGDDIFMTDTGSLGPIDAQIQIGRQRVSAHDYKEWIEEKREEAIKNGRINPFDAVMVAQSSPGELQGVLQSLAFAQVIVKDWLVKYKFKSWTIKEGKKEKVTLERKAQRAKEIAEGLTDHTRWKSHGRSIKITDLKEMGLKIGRIDDDPALADVVYRIQTICRLMFDSSNIYKIYCTADNIIAKLGAQATEPVRIPRSDPPAVEINHTCPKCGKKYHLYAKFIEDHRIDDDFVKRGYTPFPKDYIIICECGFENDLSAFKKNLEIQVGKKII